MTMLAYAKKVVSVFLLVTMLFVLMGITDVSALQSKKTEESGNVFSTYGIDVSKHKNRERYLEEDASSVVFSNADGSTTCYIFDEPVKYFDEQGNVHDKSNALSKSGVVGYSYVNANNDIQTQFPSRLSEETALSISCNTLNVKMYPECTNNAKCNLSEDDEGHSCVTYNDVFYEGCDIIYRPLFSGTKEDIVLETYSGNVFPFVIECPGYQLKKVGNAITLISDNPSFPIGRINEIVVFDSSKDEEIGRKESVNNDYIIERIDDGKYRIVVVADKEFLESASTVYPVYIDPTITINASGSGSSKTILDLPVYDGSSVNGISTGANSLGIIGKVGTLNGLDYGEGRLLMRFPGLMSKSFMSSYSYKISSATLTLKECSGKTAHTSITVSRYKSNTWNESTTNSASLLVCGEPSMSSFTFYYSGATLGTFDITNAVKVWQSNPEEGEKGVILKTSSVGSTTYSKSIYTSEGSTKPYLSVTYASRTIASGAFMPYGVANGTVHIKEIGTNATTDPWKSIITWAKNAWNNSGAGVNITVSTSGSSAFVIDVQNYSWSEMGLTTPHPDPSNPSVLIGATIEINAQATGTLLNRRRRVVTHEMGHLLFLEDDPSTNDPTLMGGLFDLTYLVYKPQKTDIYHVRYKYN